MKLILVESNDLCTNRKWKMSKTFQGLNVQPKKLHLNAHKWSGTNDISMWIEF